MLPEINRLKKKKDFDLVHNKGRFYGGSFLAVKTAKNGLDATRVGFLVGLKISKKAVVRNKIKRRLRASIRKMIFEFKPGYDVVVMVRPQIVDKNYQEIDEALVIVLKKAGILGS